MLLKFQILAMVILFSWFMAGAEAQDDHNHQTHEQEAHDNRDHDAHNHETTRSEESEEHYEEPDGHADQDEHHDHGQEFILELTPEAIALAGIEMSTATRRHLERIIGLPGEVGFNEDKLAHIAPRFAGIAQQAKCRVGDYVHKGDLMAIVESNESMNAYSIMAPISGWVIERHVTPGEFVSEENSIFVIADLSSVWVNLAVYPKDFNRIRKGHTARIKAVGSGYSTTGTIDYISPIIDFQTRSATARITLVNPDNAWRPGTFVQATIVTESSDEILMVEKEAIQFLDGISVVFAVADSGKFEPIEVVTGESDSRYTQIVSGLEEGMPYVSHGAFELKAKIVTSNLDPHAGHGH